jgi:RimJ/RimL family protein N-acetyltransferase
MPKKHKSFKTKRLQIRPVSEEDAAFILALVNTPKWIIYIGDRNVHTVNDAREYIKQRMLPQLEKLGYGNYTVIRKSDGVKIGTCGLYDRDGLNGIDIGFAFLPQYEKHGYAYESVSKLLEVAIRDFKINRISAITTKENKASQKLLVKMGLSYIKKVTIPDDSKKLLLYQL